jgi:predicted DNA-binding transcriptional regulator AlpA
MSAWLTPVQVSQQTGIAVGTLANWRSASTPANPVGPAFVKVGRLVRYDATAVDAWQQAQAVAS